MTLTIFLKALSAFIAFWCFLLVCAFGFWGFTQEIMQHRKRGEE